MVSATAWVVKRRIFDLFDLRQRGALNCHELSVCLLTLARALEAFLKLTEEGHVSELFREKDSKIYMGLEGLDRAAKLALRKWDAPDDYDSAEESDDEDHVGMKAVLATTDENDNEMLVEKKEKKEKTLERERFSRGVHPEVTCPRLSVRNRHRHATVASMALDAI